MIQGVGHIGDYKMEKFIDTIIGGIIGLIGVILGFCLQVISNKLTERKRIKEEFSEIKNGIYSVTITNDLFPELLKFKRFFVRNGHFLKNKENKYFFHTWLMEPLVEQAFTGVGYWKRERVEAMLKDLDKTRV